MLCERMTVMTIMSTPIRVHLRSVTEMTITVTMSSPLMNGISTMTAHAHVIFLVTVMIMMPLLIQIKRKYALTAGTMTAMVPSMNLHRTASLPVWTMTVMGTAPTAIPPVPVERRTTVTMVIPVSAPVFRRDHSAIPHVVISSIMIVTA